MVMAANNRYMQQPCHHYELYSKGVSLPLNMSGHLAHGRRRNVKYAYLNEFMRFGTIFISWGGGGGGGKFGWCMIV